MHAKLIPNLATVPVLTRSKLQQQLRLWLQSTAPHIGILSEPNAPTDDDWVVLSKAFMGKWHFPAKPLGEAPTWGYTRLRKPLWLKPYLANGTPLCEDQGLWLTVKGAPVAYLISRTAYYTWARHKLVVI